MGTRGCEVRQVEWILWWTTAEFLIEKGDRDKATRFDQDGTFAPVDLGSILGFIINNQKGTEMNVSWIKNSFSTSPEVQFLKNRNIFTCQNSCTARKVNFQVCYIVILDFGFSDRHVCRSIWCLIITDIAFCDDLRQFDPVFVRSVVCYVARDIEFEIWTICYRKYPR